MARNGFSFAVDSHRRPNEGSYAATCAIKTPHNHEKTMAVDSHRRPNEGSYAATCAKTTPHTALTGSYAGVAQNRRQGVDLRT